MKAVYQPPRENVLPHLYSVVIHESGVPASPLERGQGVCQQAEYLVKDFLLHTPNPSQEGESYFRVHREEGVKDV